MSERQRFDPYEGDTPAQRECRLQMVHLIYAIYSEDCEEVVTPIKQCISAQISQARDRKSIVGKQTERQRRRARFRVIQGGDHVSPTV